MRIVVLGKSGQVAQSLQGLASKDHQIVSMGRDTLDLATSTNLIAPISAQKPDAIINAAAYTAVDQAETDVTSAMALNNHAVAKLGNVAEILDVPLVHISTDYVFEGCGDRPWAPDDVTQPLGAYGRSKLAGETALIEGASRFAILRTSWVFSAFGSNFVKSMIRLGKERDTLSIVNDQIGGPTAASDIASSCIAIAMKMLSDRSLKGVWHFAGRDDCSWADFATEIFALSGIDCAVTPIPSSEYPTPAQRPLNSRLDCTTTERDFGITRPYWRESLKSVLQDLGELS